MCFQQLAWPRAFITHDMGLIEVPASLGALWGLSELILVKHIAQCMPEGVHSIITIFYFYFFCFLALETELEEFSSSCGKSLHKRNEKRKYG